MSILETIKNRRSIRKFKNTPVPENVINRLLEAMIWAPSAGNLQDRHFILVFNKEIKNKLAKVTCNQMFIADAPVLIVACSDITAISHYGQRGIKIFTHQDMGASIQNLLLAAYEEGLGTVWIGAFDSKKASEILGLPDHLFQLQWFLLVTQMKHQQRPEGIQSRIP